MRKCYLLFSILFFTLSLSLQAQDPHFSQFYANPLQLNPAMTGVFEGKFRVAANYRDQWSSVLQSVPFRTISASFDMRYRSVGRDYIGVGLNFLRDQAGESRFSQLKAAISASYLKQLGGGGYRSSDQYLIAGAQVGFGQNSLDFNRLWFSDQFDAANEIPNPGGIQTAENANIDQSDLYLDFNAGLMWYALFDDDLSLYAGGAMYHINAPDVALREGESESLYRRWVANIGGQVPLSDELSILPSALVMFQGPSFETMLGTNFRYSNHDWRELAIRAGIWTRLTGKQDNGILVDAVVFSAILELDRWNLGFSYDINTSSLTAASNSRGAFEISLIYTHPEKSRIKVKCPNF